MSRRQHVFSAQEAHVAIKKDQKKWGRIEVRRNPLRNDSIQVRPLPDRDKERRQERRSTAGATVLRSIGEVSHAAGWFAPPMGVVGGMRQNRFSPRKSWYSGLFDPLWVPRDPACPPYVFIAGQTAT